MLAAASLVVALVALSQWLPDADGLLSRAGELRALQAARPWLFGAALFGLMTTLCALALSGCGVLALAAGLFYGLAAGTLLVLLASTIGATLTFLAARHLWRDAAHRRWSHRMATIEAGLARDGAYYLFSLRVAPIVPFGLLNALMGLTAMPARRFFGVSLLGMLAGSAAYVYAGTTLAGAIGWRDVFSPGLLAALAALALLPWLTRAASRAAR